MHLPIYYKINNNELTKQTHFYWHGKVLSAGAIYFLALAISVVGHNLDNLLVYLFLLVGKHVANSPTHVAWYRLYVPHVQTFRTISHFTCSIVHNNTISIHTRTYKHEPISFALRQMCRLSNVTLFKYGFCFDQPSWYLYSIVYYK